MGKKRDSHIEVLKQVLTDVENERDRLRSARARWTTLLGPLPASAAVIAGFIAAAADKVDPVWAWVALGVFILQVWLSHRFSGLKPYREFRADETKKPDEERGSIVFHREETDLKQWLNDKIDAEERIYGDPGEEQHRLWPTRQPETLTEALNSERAAAGWVQFFFVLIIIILLVGVALH
jgi:hypothetical protein